MALGVAREGGKNQGKSFSLRLRARLFSRDMLECFVLVRANMDDVN